jgi:hypothetical protein
MTRFRLLGCALIVGLAFLAGWLSTIGHSQQQPAGLPGARPAIDAAAYPSLQAAIDALPPTGGVIRLPAGTFEISQPLVITQEDVLLEGSGTATHIKNVNADGQAAIVIQSPKIKQEPNAVLWRVQLSNLRVTGNDKSGPGILARHINEIFLHGVTLSYHGSDAIRLDNCYEDPRVCDCLLTYNKPTVCISSAATTLSWWAINLRRTRTRSAAPTASTSA